MIAAGDTFRAAAVEQLQIWGERAGVPVMTAAQGSDPASLAFDAMARAEAEGADLLLIDTAGRLQNREDLMAELAKIVRVIRKRDPEAPHNTLLVLDATTGQNALNQVEIFQKIADVTGLVMTKLDGTAKGGVLVALADRFGLPIHAIGVGEAIDDLAPFDPEEFAAALTGARRPRLGAAPGDRLGQERQRARFVRGRSGDGDLDEAVAGGRARGPSPHLRDDERVRADRRRLREAGRERRAFGVVDRKDHDHDVAIVVERKPLAAHAHAGVRAGSDRRAEVARDLVDGEEAALRIVRGIAGCVAGELVGQLLRGRIGGAPGLGAEQHAGRGDERL